MYIKENAFISAYVHLHAHDAKLYIFESFTSIFKNVSGLASVAQ